MPAIRTGHGVPLQQWGCDHWSVFLYIETVCVDGVACELHD